MKKREIDQFFKPAEHPFMLVGYCSLSLSLREQRLKEFMRLWFKGRGTIYRRDLNKEYHFNYF